MMRFAIRRSSGQCPPCDGAIVVRDGGWNDASYAIDIPDLASLIALAGQVGEDGLLVTATGKPTIEIYDDYRE